MFPGFFSLFFPPSVVTAIVGLLWVTGVDPIVLSQEDHENNIRKYVQAQQRVIDNYYNVADINDLHEQSMRGFVEAMTDTTITEATLLGTPLDTTFVEQPTVEDLRGSYERFKSAYEYVLNVYPEENLTDLTEQSVIKMMNTPKIMSGFRSNLLENSRGLGFSLILYQIPLPW
jgi:carboxyl-terminal processing protease